MDVQKDLLDQIIRLTIITKDFLPYAANKASIAPEYDSKSVPVTCANTRQQDFIGLICRGVRTVWDRRESKRRIVRSGYWRNADC
jgi:hypothetical protein